MTPAEIDSATARCCVQAANLLIGAYNQETSYLRRRSLRCALVHVAEVAKDVMPEAGITLPEADDYIG